VERLCRRINEIKNRLASETRELLGNKFRNFSKTLLEFGSLRRKIDEFVNSESIVASSSLSIPQQ
jgi:hypothetical protein